MLMQKLRLCLLRLRHNVGADTWDEVRTNFMLIISIGVTLFLIGTTIKSAVAYITRPPLPPTGLEWQRNIQTPSQKDWARVHDADVLSFLDWTPIYAQPEIPWRIIGPIKYEWQQTWLVNCIEAHKKDERLCLIYKPDHELYYLIMDKNDVTVLDFEIDAGSMQYPNEDPKTFEVFGICEDAPCRITFTKDSIVVDHSN